MRAGIEQFVAKYGACQQHMGETVATPGVLKPLSTPDCIWTDLSMDFIEVIPPSQGKTVIIAAVERPSKGAHFVPLSHPYTALS